jgi:hypothetical protein
MLLVVPRFKLCLLLPFKLILLCGGSFLPFLLLLFIACDTHTCAWDSCIFMVSIRDRLAYSLVLQKLCSLWSH